MPNGPQQVKCHMVIRIKHTVSARADDGSSSGVRNLMSFSSLFRVAHAQYQSDTQEKVTAGKDKVYELKRKQAFHYLGKRSVVRWC